jgi:hypothetical protein
MFLIIVAIILDKYASLVIEIEFSCFQVGVEAEPVPSAASVSEPVGVADEKRDWESEAGLLSLVAGPWVESPCYCFDSPNYGRLLEALLPFIVWNSLDKKKKKKAWSHDIYKWQFWFYWDWVNNEFLLLIYKKKKKKKKKRALKGWKMVIAVVNLS